MAYAFRSKMTDGFFFIALDKVAIKISQENVTWHIMDGRVLYNCDAAFINEKTLRVLEGAFLYASAFKNLTNILLICARDKKTKEILSSEQLFFHQSFYNDIIDICTVPALPPYKDLGFTEYKKPKLFAVFTHSYNETTMLKLWERYYSRIVPYKDLYVIDHGSEIDPSQYLNEKTNIIRLPRGGCDHNNISQFCGYFQRFLLTQYKWVLHVDTDELVVCKGGLIEYISKNSDVKAILRSTSAINIVHKKGEESIDPQKLVTEQRGDFIDCRAAYKKPALASIPVTWTIGFHIALESPIIDVTDMCLVHLDEVDINIKLARNTSWIEVEKSEFDEKRVGCLNRTTEYEELMSDWEGRETKKIPSWMQGLF